VFPLFFSSLRERGLGTFFFFRASEAPWPIGTLGLFPLRRYCVGLARTGRRTFLLQPSFFPIHPLALSSRTPFSAHRRSAFFLSRRSEQQNGTAGLFGFFSEAIFFISSPISRFAVLVKGSLTSFPELPGRPQERSFFGTILLFSS